MKKLSFLFLLLSAAFYNNAQITFTLNDIAGIGDTIIQGYDDNPDSFSPGGTGAQTWDFSGMIADNQDTLIFIENASAPFGASFPDADLSVEILQDDNGTPDTMFMYIDTDDTYLHILGMSNSDVNDVHSYPYQNVMVFPLTYGNEFYSESVSIAKIFNGSDSVMYKLYANDTINVDAFGYLTLSAGTYNTLRLYHNVLRIDSVFIKSGSDWLLVNSQEYPQIYYEWWTDDPDVKMKVAELKVDEQGAVTESNFMIQAYIHTSSVKKLLKENLIIKNSNNSTIQICNIPKDFNKIAVFDISGKQIVSKNINTSECFISLKGNASGIYIVSLYSGNEKISKKIIIR